MSRRLLIVVSAFCPAMLADMQRARMLAWELPKFGWEVEVLTPRATEVRQDAIEPDSTRFFPCRVRTHQVGSSARRLFEALGSRTHSWRTLWPIRKMGTRLVKSKRFDLVYFSTTTWVYFSLGPKWWCEFGVPYVLDFHDPLVKEQERLTLATKTLKGIATTQMSRVLEHRTVRNAAGLIAVSPKYIALLRKRYESLQPKWLQTGRHAVIPFGALESDLTSVQSFTDTPERERSHTIRIVYVGAGGPIMERSFGLICRTLAFLRRHGHRLARRVSIELYGTIYAWKAGDVKNLEAIAELLALGGLVQERPERVSYQHSLELLLGSDGALILGVDDEGYMPSKLFTYALSGKPLLASLHRASPAFGEFCRMPSLGHALWFSSSDEMPIIDAANEVASFLEEAAEHRNFDRRPDLRPFLAPAMARRHSNLFDACVTGN